MRSRRTKAATFLIGRNLYMISELRCAKRLLRGLLLLSVLLARSVCAAPCGDSADSGHAAAALKQYLQSEASGDRLEELIGRSPAEAFSRNVVPSEIGEPGWDTIDIRPGFSISELSCSRDINGQEWTAKVHFPAGWWFSRENFGQEEPSIVAYRLSKHEEHFLLVPPLPQPFLSPTGAKRFIGHPPFQKAGLLELLNQF